MKIMPTANGGLQIDADDPGDWQLLRGITHDAVLCDESLARRLGLLISNEEIARDWREYIHPDLEAGFADDVRHVATSIASAHLESGAGPGSLWITRDTAFHWYSALNQARLALEEQFHFGPGPSVDSAGLPPARRAAFLRSQFYCAIQSLLLEHALG